MNYFRLYSALFCALFISMPQVTVGSFLGDLASVDNLEGLSAKIKEATRGDFSKLTDEDIEAVATKLANLTKGNEQAVRDFLTENPSFKQGELKTKFSEAFKKQQVALRGVQGSEAKIAQEFKQKAPAVDANEQGAKAAILKKNPTEQTTQATEAADNSAEQPTESVAKNKEALLAEFKEVNSFVDEMSGSKSFAGFRKAESFADKAREISKVKTVEQAQALGTKIEEEMGDVSQSGELDDEQKEKLAAAQKKLTEAKNLKDAQSALIDLRKVQNDIRINKLPEELQQAARAANDAMYSKFQELLNTGEDLSAKVKVEELPGGKIAKSGAEVGGATVEVTKLEDFLATTVKEESLAFRSKADTYLDEQTEKFRTETLKQPQSEGFFDKAKSFLFDDAKSLQKKLTDFRKKNLSLDRQIEEEIGGKGGRLSRLGRSIKSKFIMTAETLVSAVLFMVPNIFQSAYLAQQEKAAQLATWAKPIEYGGKVWQIPDWCINLDNPSESIPLYAQIPVNYVGEEINPTLVKMFANTISQGEPDSNNPMSEAIHNAGSDFWSLGSTTATKINRYRFTADFLEYTDVAVMYGSPTSMAETGTVNIGGSEFTGDLISLKTGQVIDGSGSTIDASGVPQATGIPLIPGKDSANIWGMLMLNQTAPASQGLKPLSLNYEKLINHMETLGIKVNFTQYDNVVSGSAASNVGKSNTAYFDVSCIDDETGSLKKSPCRCLLVEGLTDLQNGLELNVNGQVSYASYQPNETEDQEAGTVVGGTAGGLNVEKNSTAQITEVTGLAQSVAKGAAVQASNAAASAQPTATAASTLISGAKTVGQETGWQGLGAVIPVFGWGDAQYPNIIGKSQYDTALGKNVIATGIFQGFAPSDVEFGGITKVNKNADQSTSSQKMYADPDTLWAAQGCWIYLCSQTPFIQALQESNPDIKASVVGSLTDYIVFMDQDLNIVPLMVPTSVSVDYQDSSENHSYTKSELTLNPVIKFWTSLVFYNQPYFLYQGSPVMYDLKGVKYATSNLGTIAGDKNPSGFIPFFLNNPKGASISSNYPDIYNQFLVHKAALLYKLKELDMTVGGILFKLSDYKLIAQSQSMPLYTAAKGSAFPCLTTNLPELLVALDNNGNPIALPNANLLYMQSLITDITYILNKEEDRWEVALSLPGTPAGQVATGYSFSPFKLNDKMMPLQKSDGSFEINTQATPYLQNLGVYLGIKNPTQDGTTGSLLQSAASYVGIGSSAQGFLSVNTTAVNDPTDAALLNLNQQLVSYVQKQRLAWLKALDRVVRFGVGENTQLANLVNTLTFEYAKANNCYVYELNPGLSLASSDYFIAINSATPNLKAMRPTIDLSSSKNSNVRLVSLLTGTMYDLQGNQIFDKKGFPAIISIPKGWYASGKSTAEILYDAFTSKFIKLPENFVASYKNLVLNFAQAQMQVGNPISFGKCKVNIRSVDKNSGNYVYFDAAQATKSTIIPTDMYLILDAKTEVPSAYNKDTDQVLVSLITGVVFDNSGMMISKLPQDKLTNIIAALKGNWSPWISQNVQRLKDAYQEHQELLKTDQANLEKRIADFSKSHDAAMNKNQTMIAQIIKNLEPAGSGLPVPYAGLEYDKLTGNYVHLSPLQEGEYLYLFMSNGRVYDKDGAYRTSYQPAHIQAVRDMYGVIIDSKTGKQKLGIPMMQPTIIMDETDTEITLGKSGKSLVASGSKDFPGEKITTVQKGYGLYFSKIMNTYYVLDSKKDRWMSVDGGHVYQKNGQPVIDSNSVAMSKDGAPLLLYKNQAGFMQTYMKDGSDYANVSESNQMITWYGLSEPFNSYNVTTNASSAEAEPTQYTVEDDNSKSTTYTLSKNYVWYMLILVPIDDTGKLLEDIPGSAYTYIQVVKNLNEKITHMIYNGTAYKVSSSSAQEDGATRYQLQPMEQTATSETTITLTDGLIDSQTTAPYLVVVDGENQYPYAYIPKTYTTEQQETNRVEIFDGVTSASSLPINVGPNYVTHVLFEADLPVKAGKVQVTPVSAKSVYNAPTENPEAEAFDFKFAAGKNGFGGVFTTTESNPRFLYKIAGSISQATPSTITFDYIAKDAYIDLKTAAAYDAATGKALGQTLNYKDFFKVLDTCSVNVSNKTLEIKNKAGKVVKTINKEGKNRLVYRDVAQVQEQQKTIASDESLEDQAG